MRDRFFIRFIIVMFTLCIVNTSAYCLYVDSVTGVDAIKIYEDLIVTKDGIFSPAKIDVWENLTIINHGVINSDFYINDSHWVYITNSGTIQGNGVFYVAPQASLIQVVQSDKDITNLTVDKNFSVLVRNADDISLAAVMGIATNADKLILENSTLVLNGAEYNSDRLSIELVGDVVLKVNSVHSVDYTLPVLRNVSETGNVHFDVPDMNPLYNAHAYVNGGDLYMKIVRETDYRRMFQNDVGNFLHDLRRDRPDDKLLRAMDNASDIDVLNSIMHTSVRLHPVNLMAPVRRMHMMDALDRWRNADSSEVNTTTDVIFSDTTLMVRTSMAITDSVTRDLSAIVSGYVGAFGVADGVNDFYGGMYGANAVLHFDDGTIIGNLSGGIARADFDIGPVFDGGATVNNPAGISGYAAIDIGTYLYREYDLTIMPFAGVIARYMSVLNDSDMGALANFGMELNLSEHDFDIFYDYGLCGSILSDGAYNIGVYGKFTAPDDDLGGQISAALIHDELGFGYKISVSVNMLF